MSCTGIEQSTRYRSQLLQYALIRSEIALTVRINKYTLHTDQLLLAHRDVEFSNSARA